MDSLRLLLTCCLVLVPLYRVCAELPSPEDFAEAIADASDAMDDDEEAASQMATLIKNDSDYKGGAANIGMRFLGSTKLGAGMSQSARFVQYVLQILMDRFDLDKEDIQELIKDGYFAKVLEETYEELYQDMPWPPPSSRKCPYPRGAKCNKHARYRSIDGSCNNLKNPYWGKSMRAFRRDMDPDYADGHNSPRTGSYGPLPSPRKVSLTVHTDVDVPSQIATMLHMTFGQIVDHDIDRTAVTKLVDSETGELVDVPCGMDGCSTTGPENAACVPIPVDEDDPIFGGDECIKFVRSTEAITDKCPTGFREQLNQITSYFDASMVYGSDMERFKMLRDSDASRGKMATTPGATPTSKRFMPLVDLEDCQETGDTTNVIKCFLSGDTRTNEQAALSAIHTMFIREHNRIEEQLYTMNPHWTGRRLFEESRKIFIATWQVIVYNEYLPLLMGKASMDKFGLTLLSKGFFKDYDKKLNADTSNVHATASFRCGHSQIGNFLMLINQMYAESSALNEDLTNLFFRPSIHFDPNVNGNLGFGMDAVMRGQVVQNAETMDPHFALSVAGRMFTLEPPHGAGTDLPALNIMRGRDHGLPAYNEWRRFCDLPVANDFDDMVDIPSSIQTKFEYLFDTVDDVDLFSAGISETPLAGSMVGPTFACLLGDQFRRYRRGDRFWHETKDKKLGFTKGQLKQIRKASFARLMCDNLDEVDKVQRFAMMLPRSEALKLPNLADFYALEEFYSGDDNERRPCTDIPSMDLSKWKD